MTIYKGIIFSIFPSQVRILEKVVFSKLIVQKKNIYWHVRSCECVSFYVNRCKFHSCRLSYTLAGIILFNPYIIETSHNGKYHILVSCTSY
jgi:hypothetical protein